MSNRTIEFKGQPLTIQGSVINVGDKLPAFSLHATDFSAVNLAGMTGAVRLISVVPSLDTGVCDAQTKRFNEEAAKLGDSAKVITVSADPPFTQRRWANDSEVKNITGLGKNALNTISAPVACCCRDSGCTKSPHAQAGSASHPGGNAVVGIRFPYYTSLTTRANQP